VKTECRFRKIALMVACALVVLGAFAPAANARRVERKSATAVLPAVDLLGRLRDRERIVSLSTSTAANAEIEVFLQVFCFDKQLRVHRRQHTVTGTGQLRLRLRKPRGREDCSASASVKVTSRPLSPSGELPAPIRLGAALYARS
jgi:hypothetical protein